MQTGELAKRLAEKLRATRGEISQLQFARKLGVSKSSLNRIEAAEQNVTMETIEYLCKRLKCDIGDLFPKTGDAENPPPPTRR